MGASNLHIIHVATIRPQHKVYLFTGLDYWTHLLTQNNITKTVFCTDNAVMSLLWLEDTDFIL